MSIRCSRSTAKARPQAGFDEGIERALRRLLVSPEFLFRVERDPATVAAGRAYRISDVELASRLSFFLWSSIPDDALLDLAERGQLSTPAVLAAQVRRMLADPRADAFVTNFAGQWLFLRNLDAAVPVQSVFPDFDDGLRQAFRRETELFFDSIVREDRSAFDLLRADYTFLNERLAQHYGMPNVKGSHFRRVTLREGQRAQRAARAGRILTVTSYPDRTSPVVRGKWILENLLGTPPPPPLPNVPPLKPTNNDRRRAVDAAADGAASRQPGVRQLPRDDGSARPLARELRRGRQVAHARRVVGDRSTRPASRPTARCSRAPRASESRCCARTASSRR